MEILRESSFEDAELLFIWVNDQSARANSFSQKPVLLQDHLDWFKDRLASENSHILIMEYAGIPVGQVRFDLNGDAQWEVDYSIDPSYRGKGFGKKLIYNGVKFLRGGGYIQPILAKVKETNHASANVFRNQGFEEQVADGMIVFNLA